MTKSLPLLGLLFALFLCSCSDSDDIKLEIKTSDLIGTTLMDPFEAERSGEILTDPVKDTVYYKFLDEESLKVTLLDYSNETGEIALKKKVERDCLYFIEDGNKLLLVDRQAHEATEPVITPLVGFIGSGLSWEVQSFTRDLMLVDLYSTSTNKKVGNCEFLVVH